MHTNKILGSILILIGVTISVLNLLILVKVKNTCKDDKVVKDSNTGNLVLGGVLTIIGIGLFMTGHFQNTPISDIRPKNVETNESFSAF
jgi:uncharacterized membrane protein